MPCYTAWNECLEPGTAEYARAEDVVRAKLQAIKHIIDYYYAVNDFPLPKLPEGVHVDPLRQPKSSKESQIRQAICHHFACDEVSVSAIYDVCSLLDEKRAEDRAYLAVMLPSASLLRAHPEKFRTVY